MVNELEQVIEKDHSFSDKEGPASSFKQYFVLYLEYLNYLKTLERIYNDLVHPQKREHVRGTLTLIIQRIIQLRHYFFNNPHCDYKSQVETWEFLDVDDEAFSPELKFRWSTMETAIPQFLKDDCKTLKMSRNNLVAQCVRRYQLNDDNKQDSVTDGTKYDGTPSLLDKKMSTFELEDFTKTELNDIRDQAAITIQRNTRGYLIRLHRKRSDEWIKMFIGLMKDPFEYDLGEANKKCLKEIDERKEYTKRKNEIGYKDALTDLRDEVRREEGFAMKQDLRNARIEWVTSKIAETNQVPESLQEFYDTQVQNDASGSAANNMPFDHGKFPVTLYKQFKDDILKFNILWRCEDESSKNEVFSTELAKDLVVRDQIRAEIQEIVDNELLRNLKRINQLDCGKKHKAKDKAKKGKNGKSRKGKKEKGLPGEKIAEMKGIDAGTIIERLVQHGLVEIPQYGQMDDLICSHESKIRAGGKSLPSATLSEARRVSSVK